MIYGKYTIEPNEILESLKGRNLQVGTICYALELAIEEAHSTIFNGANA